MSLQEKFQITVPPKPETDHEWCSFADARSTGEAGFRHSNNANADADVTMKTNYTPPGMDVSNQARKRIENMPLVMSGANDVSGDVNAQSFEKGYTRRHMNGTDDIETGEHMDHFYGEAVDELGNVGFLERNNYCDRS